MTSAAGTESYTLDALNRLTTVSYPNSDSASYTYDSAGNRLTLTLNGTTTNYTYDTAGRLVSQGAKALTYDAAGNMTSIGADTYGWDWAGRLASANVGGTASSYTYDGSGIRVAATTAGSTTNYLWDRNASLPTVVDDGTQGYVQTDQGLLEQLGSTASYPLSDALGSVRALESPTPSALGSTNYDVFGSIRSQSGQQSIFGFTGQQTDPTGLSFLRSRYYNPTLGRFVSPDSVQPNASGTQGYDLYAYVANNPTGAIDPSGQIEGESAIQTSTTARALSLLERLSAALKAGFQAVVVALRIAAKACVARIVLCFETIEGAAVVAKVFQDITGIGPSPQPSPNLSSGAPIPGVDTPAQPATSTEEALRRCLQSNALNSLARTGPANPCSIRGLNLYFPGNDVEQTTAHILEAIVQKPLPALLHRRDIRGMDRPNLKSKCRGITSNQVCDEYPFFSTEENGLYQVSYKAVLASEQTDMSDPGSQVRSLNSFYRGGSGCSVPRGAGPASAFGVIPQSYVPSFHVCSDGRVGY